MARKKKLKKAVVTKKKKDEPYKPGDFCYYLDVNNKIGFAEIKSINVNYDQPVYNIVDQTSFRFGVIEHMFCCDEESFFKRKKRKDIIEEKNK